MARSTRSTWRQASHPPGSAKPSNRRGLRLFGLCAALLAGLGVLAAWILYPKTMNPPAVRTVAVREYEARMLPPVAFAAQDSQLLLKRFAGAKSDDYTKQMRDQFEKLLRGLKQTSEELVVMHLCALARAEGDKVYVLPGDAHPDRPETWIELGEVLEAMKACPAKNKLLLLDVMRPFVDARLGVLEPDISDRVHAYLEGQGEMPFWILCACGKGERSLVSEELGQSVFAYFLDRGLSGAADGAGAEGKKDQRISVRELAAYTQSAVDRWAKANRGLAQTPTLLGNDADFLLAQFDASKPLETRAIQDKVYPSWLRDAWARRDGWRRDASYRLVPRLAFHLDTVLLRTELRWRAGIEEDRLKKDIDEEAEMVKEHIAIARSPHPQRHPSLTTLRRLQGPLEDAKQQAPLDELAQALKAILPKAIEPGIKPETMDKAKKEEFDKAHADIKMKLPKLPATRAQRIVFETAVNTAKLSPGKLLLLLEYCRELSELSEGKYVETIALERLGALRNWSDTNGWTWPEKEVHAWLQLTRDAEEAWAALAESPAVVTWLEPRIKAADELRRKADANLFDIYNLKWKEVIPTCSAAAKKYGDLLSEVARLRAAQREWDDAMLVLPALVPVLASQRGDDAPDESAWRNFVDELTRLGNQLASPKADHFSAPQADIAGQVESRRRELLRRVKDRFARAIALQDGTPADYWQMQTLLLSPVWTAEERVKLWQASRAIALQLHKEQDKSVSIADLLVERNDAIRRRAITLSMDLLRAAGLDQQTKLSKALAEADKTPTAAKWRVVAEELRGAWAKELPERLKPGVRSPFEIDRAARLLPLYDTERPGATEAGLQLRNPLLPVLREQRQALAAALARRYEAEAEAVKTQESSQRAFGAFYRQAAEDVRVVP